MTEPLPSVADPLMPPAGDGAGLARSAGALLKAAREREGLHLAVLAATIKVAPAKLEALEQDRHDLLPNSTFARALAQSVCRSLKIDPRPVLALLPQVEMPPLEGAMGKLNTPFQDRSSRSAGASLTWASKPLFWAGGLLLLAALVIGLVPADLIESWTRGVLQTATPSAVSGPDAAASSAVGASPAESVQARMDVTPEPAAAAPSSPVASSLASTSSAIAAPVPAPAIAAPPADPVVGASTPPAASGVGATAGAGLLRLEVTADSWIEVVDAQGRSALSRIVQKGEALGLDGALPLRVRVGNAGATRLTFRGQVLDLGPYTRDNVARLELR